MSGIHTSPALRHAGWLITLLLVLVTACSSEPEEPTDDTSALSTTGAAVTTTAVAAVTTTGGTPESTTSTTEPFPSRAVLDYLEAIRNLAVGVGESALDMRAANNDWDNRSETGVSYPDTEAALEDLEDRVREIREAVAVVDPPADRGLPVEHQTAWVAVGEMADAATNALAGLRSPDTGGRRRAALAEFIVAFERFNGAVDRIVEIIGVGAGITVATTEAAPATTAASATTSSSTTSTTAAAAATTSTTSSTVPPTPSSTSTVPPVTDVQYSVIDSGGSADPVRVWLTVSVGAGATKAQMARLGARLATEYRLSKEYQALIIHFVHFPEGTATLGTWTDAPFGDWDRAVEVEQGDYSQHQIGDSTKEKDWSQLPTDVQIELYRSYTDYRSTLEDADGQVPPDDELVPLAAEELGVTEAVIEDAINAWETWVAS